MTSPSGDGVQSLADQVFGGGRAVGVGGVDVVAADVDGMAQELSGCVGVGGVGPVSGAGELDCAVADSVDWQVAADRECAACSGGQCDV